MGLDQDLWAFKKGQDTILIAEWRKHYELNAWMGRYDYSTDYDCELADLTHEILNEWERDIHAGVFDLDYDCHVVSEEELRNSDLETIQKARDLMNDGWKIHYSSCC